MIRIHAAFLQMIRQHNVGCIGSDKEYIKIILVMPCKFREIHILHKRDILVEHEMEVHDKEHYISTVFLILTE